MTIKDMGSDHFLIDANDLPLDMFRQLPTAYPQKDAIIYLGEDQDGSVFIESAYYDLKKLDATRIGRMELLSMYEEYKDNERQEIAEGA